MVLMVQYLMMVQKGKGNSLCFRIVGLIAPDPEKSEELMRNVKLAAIS